MAEVLSNRGSKYKVIDQIDDLSLVKQLVEISNNVIIYGELEIEPFEEFSIPFQAEYWYLKYSLLKHGSVMLDSNQQLAMYDEKNLNTIWLSVRNDNGALIDCKDGNWLISFPSIHNEIFLKRYKLLEI